MGEVITQKQAYHMSSDEMAAIIKACKASDYKISELIFSGGEPTLWKNMEECVSIASQSSIFNQVNIGTNGAKWQRLIPMRSHLSKIFVSKYPSNEGIRESMYASVLAPKLHQWSGRFTARPDHVLNLGMEPSNGWPCKCHSVGYYDNYFYSCGPIISLILRFPNSANYQMKTPVAPFFVEKLESSQDLCKACVANPLVENLMRRSPPSSAPAPPPSIQGSKPLTPKPRIKQDKYLKWLDCVKARR
jgi:hypothetical protein